MIRVYVIFVVRSRIDHFENSVFCEGLHEIPVLIRFRLVFFSSTITFLYEIRSWFAVASAIAFYDEMQFLYPRHNPSLCLEHTICPDVKIWLRFVVSSTMTFFYNMRFLYPCHRPNSCLDHMIGINVNDRPYRMSIPISATSSSN